MRNLCFTVYKFAKPEFITVLPDGVRFIVWQLEKGEKNQRDHLQGYMELLKPKELNPIKKILLDKTAHIEARKGTALEAANYCRKGDTRVEGPWELGEMSKQGARADLESFRDAIRERKTNVELLDDHLSSMARYPRLLNMVRETMRPPDTPDLVVSLFLGKPDTGKSRFARSEWDRRGVRWWTPPIQQGGSHWYDGYDGHDGVLIDDFKGAMTLQDLLRVLDIYPVYVPFKGGHVWFRPKEIVITSNYHPLRWYSWEGREESIPALRRRIHRIYDWDAVCMGGDPPLITDKGWDLFIFP